MGAPTDARADEDIKRWSIIVREGHAYAASVFRQGGFAVTTAAEDTERVRRIFVDHVAKPRRTLLHGQSWGAMVATRTAELYPKSWDGMLLTSGVVGGPATYDFRIDIRALYQHLCGNHPKPGEPAYALALGLPAGATFSNAELNARINECLALNKPAAERSAEQRAKA
ncbi:MAG: lysophospholipase, partial [Burkholderiaceae bacterium]|nr:lysophospholipase [Burkholderiaceae bacterium]